MRKVVHQQGPTATVQFTGWSLSYQLTNTGDFTQYWSAVHDGGYENGTTRLLGDLLPHGGSFVDIGANIGYYTAEAAHLVGPSGRVFSFEPNPPTFDRLQLNVGLNRVGGMVRTFNCALADARSPVQLYLMGDDDAISSMVNRTKKSIPVEAIPGDDILAEQPVDAIKVDVEGAELQVLRGLIRTLRRNEKASLIVEWNRIYRTRELWDFLSARFDVARIRDAGMGYDLVRLGAFSEAHHLPLCNLLCRPR